MIVNVNASCPIFDTAFDQQLLALFPLIPTAKGVIRHDQKPRIHE
jgi:hypothetical protein